MSLQTSCNWDHRSESRALSIAKRDGNLDKLQALADAALEALTPVDPTALRQRLTFLGMTMLHGKGEAEITAWLHETVRLLQDLPQHHLFTAIDECVKEPGRVFAPTVGEIRERVAEPLQRAEREACRLRRLAKLVAEGVEIPDWEEPELSPWEVRAASPEPKQYCTGEEAREILREQGLLGTVTGDVLEKALVAGQAGQPAPQTRADYIRQGMTPPSIKAETRLPI